MRQGFSLHRDYPLHHTNGLSIDFGLTEAVTKNFINVGITFAEGINKVTAEKFNSFLWRWKKVRYEIPSQIDPVTAG